MVRTSLMAGAAVALMLTATTASQAQNVPDMLRGLMTGNQNQDQALRDAYERGYQKGRQDEAQLSRRNRGRDEDRRYEDDNRGTYQRDPYRR